MSRKDMEKKQSENRVPEEKPATPLAVGLLILGLVGIAFVAFLIVWGLTDGPKPALGEDTFQSGASGESVVSLL